MNRHYLPLIYLSLLIAIFACNNQSDTGVELISPEGFDTIINGRQVQIYTLRNESGCTAQFTNFGGRWLSMWVPDRTGSMTDVLLGFNNLEDYLSSEEPYHGAIVGRICGRINNAKFSLDGTEYSLASNDLFGAPEKNHLHGGLKGFHVQVWDGKSFTRDNGDEGLLFTYASEDGEEGFPGKLEVEVSYVLTNNNELQIEYSAKTDKPTIVNMTNHSYFNLNGEGNGNILGHQMKLNSEKYVECDEELVPTGELKHVEGSPLDFREFASMGYGIDMDHDQIIKGKGYAAAMVLKEQNSEEVQLVAEAFAEPSGIKLELYSNQPNLQIYNAWLMSGKNTGKSGKPYPASAGFVLETQGYPDAPNFDEFPSIVLQPGEVYNHIAIFKFSYE